MMPVAIGALGRYHKRLKDGQVHVQRKQPSYYNAIYEAIRNKENHYIDPNFIKLALNEQRAKDQSYNEKLERFGEIKVSTNKNSYQAGDSVKGVVSFKLKQQILAKQLILKVKGYQFVQLNNDEINKKILSDLKKQKNNQIQNSEESLQSFIETFVIYDHKFVIYEEDENQLFLQNQNYVIPFEIQLEDKNLPRSFQIIEKDVQLVTIYKISAIIPIDPSSTAASEIQDFQNKKIQLKFTEVLNMTEQPQMMKMKHLVSQFESKFSGFSCCSKPKKSLDVSIFLDKNQQIVNHDIMGHYELHVHDGVSAPPFKALQFKLIRFLKVKFPEDGVDRKLKNDIQVYTVKIDQKSLKREQLKDNQCKFIGQFSIRLPEDLQPTITSTNVQLQYALVCRPIKFGLFGKCVPTRLVSEGKVLIYYLQDVNTDGNEVPQDQLILKHCESSQVSPEKAPSLSESQKLNKQIQLKLLKLQSGKLTYVQEMEEKEEIF